jgi:S1-C subfamily serine protease
MPMPRSRIQLAAFAVVGLLFLALPASRTGAETVDADKIFSSLVRLTSEVPPDARTAQSLGRTREGSGVVIDDQGLVLTIGYLILEAMAVTVFDRSGQPVPADIIAYDHQSGFGLVRARAPLDSAPVRLGRSSDIEEGNRALVVPFGGVETAAPVFVVSRRPFAGYWEYLLERAIFTSPPHPVWSGAALISEEGKLVGIGSLIVGDAGGEDSSLPGNMFVPIDVLKPVLGELLGEGRRASPPRPWLGMFAQTTPMGNQVMLVSPESPAQRAGVARGDVVVGVMGEPIGDLADFYRKVWALGPAGIDVPLTLLRDGEPLDIVIKSGRRDRYLKFKHTY